MHSYLTSIGFNTFMNRDEENDMIEKIVSNPDTTKSYKKENGAEIVEYSRFFADKCGITVVGECDKSGFHFLYYFPFIQSEKISCTQEIFVNRRVDIDAYTGMCEDVRIGVSLIFYLQNAAFYFCSNPDERKGSRNIFLSALAAEGRILLPTEKNDEYNKASKKKLKEREKLINEAKRGDQGAIESLTLEEIDQYTSVVKRIQKEDLFSIVETTFMPCGSESDIYNIIGIISSVKEEINKETKEAVYVLGVEVNNLHMTVCVSGKRTLGQPAVGRRFKGTIWLQGIIK